MALLVTVIVGITAASSRPVSAQIFGGERPERPNRALFGSGVSDTDQQLVFNAGLGLGADRLAVPATEAADPAEARRSSFGTGSASLNYGLNRDRFSLGLDAHSSAQYSIGRSLYSATTYGGGLTSSFRISSRTFVQSTVGVSRQPLSIVALFPDMFDTSMTPVVTNYELEGRAGSYLSNVGTISVDHNLTRRSSLSSGYSYSRDVFPDASAAQFYHAAWASYGYAIAEGLSARIGYSRGLAQSAREVEPNTRRIRNDSINGGVDFARTLSFSRRTSVSFSTGSTVISDATDTRYDVVGSASMAYELGRTWQAGGAYNRRAGFHGALREPVFSDSVLGTVTGLLGRRVSISSGVGATTGSIGMGGNESSYRALHAIAGVQTALTRFVGMQFSYIYYRYRLGSSVDLLSPMGTRANRQAVQVSLALSAPIFQRVRSSDAAR